MLIETWVAALLLVGICIFGGIGLIGWMIADQRLENAIEKNKELLKENGQLKNKINLIRLRIEMEEKK